jgi:AcrR family transcriptional regulator
VARPRSQTPRKTRREPQSGGPAGVRERARPADAAELRGGPDAARPSPVVAGLAASQLRRIRRIVDAAVRLAEEGGFEGMRLRDVAEASDVALGTLYKYFRSKEDILLFALSEEVGRLEAAVAARPPEGDTALERIESFFRRATAGLTRRPQFSRAVLRSIAAGDGDLALQIASFHLRMTRLIVATLRGEVPDLSAPVDGSYGSERERQIAFVLMNFWFSSLSGWAGGLHAGKTVSEQVRTAASLMLGED